MKASKFVAIALAVIVALCIAFSYGTGVLVRSRIVDHNGFETFISPDGQHRLEYAVSSVDFNWMRLYRRDCNEVIADRRFWGQLPYRIDWYEDSVNVGAAEESGIDLPPPWWER